ncbi:glycosyltransferase family 2 protein [Methylocucumis oryzae]|uniref:glycosyltransferase family 2 protein n=1 Tax=Methylocucumis oryzae TaxID=1632867 RepID=UPI000695DDBD|nr:glycosyltransferase [Methylocucumis oryzae]
MNVCLRSVYEQTVPATEVIVVNDGSKSEEADFIDELATRMPFTLIHKENGGQGSARNKGVQASTSDYICFLDQDDYFLPNHIEVLLDAIPDDDLRLGVVYGDLYEADAEGNIIRMSMVKQHAIHPKRDIISLLCQDMFILPSASLIVRKVFLEIGGFDTQFKGYEDDDFFLRMFRAGYSNYYVDKPVTIWCIHTNSTSYSVLMSRSRFSYFCKLSQLYPDSRIQNRFYFRDLLVARFGSSFIKDAVEAVIYDDKNKTELVNIYFSYRDMVLANEFVGFKYKLKLKLIGWILTTCPAQVINLLVEFAKFAVPLRRMINI